MPSSEIYHCRLPSPPRRRAAAVKYLGRLVPRASIGRAVIAKRSVDARRRGNIRFLYSVDVEVDSTAAPVLSADYSVSLLPDSADEVRCGSERLSARPVIVGFGPAGMFASLTLAALGYAPLVIERGGSVGGACGGGRAFLPYRRA